jgi:hypothetical protein
MAENDWVAQQFEENRGHLRGAGVAAISKG